MKISSTHSLTHKISLLLVIFLCFNFSFSQEEQTLLDSIQTGIFSKISTLNTNNVETGILYDRTLPLSALTAYANPEDFIPDEPLPEELVSNAAHFLFALEDLHRADILNRYPKAEELIDAHIPSPESNEIPIGLLNADLNTFRPDALEIGALVIQVHENDSILVNNPEFTESLYHTWRNGFVVSPIVSRTTDSIVTFTTPETLWLETAEHTVTNLEADFGDGNGFIPLSKNQNHTVAYETRGKKEILFRASFSDDSNKTVKSSFIINAPALSGVMNFLAAMDCGVPASGSFSSHPYTFQGHAGYGTYQIYTQHISNNNTTCITKPVIVVEGFDPDDSVNHIGIYNLLNNTELPNANRLSTKLWLEGYNVITLNFEPRTINGEYTVGGSDHIERNAMVLVKLIEEINDYKQPNAQPTKVIGFSMGGLVARYALRYMEQQGMDHQADLYISVDAPHKGAIIPRGVQEVVKLAKDLVPGSNNNIDQAMDLLNSPAARQMVIKHTNGNTQYNTFYNNLNSMGYPQNTRNVAVVNGSTNGTGINEINQRYYNGTGHVINPITGFWHTGNLRMNFTHHSGTARVFYWRHKLFNIINISSRDINITTDGAYGSHENAPSGILTLEELDNSILKLTEYNFNYILLGISQKLSSDSFSFIPTKSALDFQGNTHYFQDLHFNMVCTGNTPFDTYHAPLYGNEEHMYLSGQSSLFLFDEITGNPRDPVPSSIYGGGILTGTYSVPQGNMIGETLTFFAQNDIPGGSGLLVHKSSGVVYPDVYAYLNLPPGSSNANWTVMSDTDGAITEILLTTGTTLRFRYNPLSFNSIINFNISYDNECGTEYYSSVGFKINPNSGSAPLSSNSTSNYSIYPVPADTVLLINSNLLDNLGTTVALYDFYGQLKKEVAFGLSDQATIDVTNLNEGLYALQIVNGSEIENKMILIAR